METMISVHTFLAYKAVLGLLGGRAAPLGLQRDMGADGVRDLEIAYGDVAGVEFDDVGAGGYCGWFVLADALWGDKERYQDVREAIANGYQMEECDERDPFAVQRFSRGRRLQKFVRLRDPTIRRRLTADGHSTLLETLRAWGGAGGDNADSGAPTRIFNSVECSIEDPKFDLCGALKARGIYVQSPSWLHHRNQTTWLEQTEMVMVQAVFDVQIVLLSARDGIPCIASVDAGGDAADEQLAIFETDFSRPIVMAFVSNSHYLAVRLRDVDDEDHARIEFDEPVVNGDGFVPGAPALVEGGHTDVSREMRRCVFQQVGMKISSSKPSLVVVVCNECDAKIMYKSRKGDRVFELTRNDAHCCMAAAVNVTRLTSSELAAEIVGVFKQHGKPLSITMREVRVALNVKGIRVGSTKLKRIRIDLQELLVGTLDQNYARLRSFLQLCSSGGSGFYSHVLADGDQFQSVFVAPSYAKGFTSRSVRIVIADGAHASGASGGGTWLSSLVPVVGIDARAQTSTVLVAISFHSSGETSAAWAYHFEHMRRAGLFHDRVLVSCVTDGRAGLRELVENNPLSGNTRMHQARDLVHMCRNIAALKSDGAPLVGLPWSDIYALLQPLATAQTPRKFSSAMRALVAIDHASEIPAALRQKLARVVETRYCGAQVNQQSAIANADGQVRENAVPTGAWADAFCPKPRNGILTSNMAESFNEVLNTIQARHGPIVFALTAVLRWADDQFCKLREKATSDAVCNPRFAPLYGAMGKNWLDRREKYGFGAAVVLASHDPNSPVFHVREATSTFEVCPNRATCTCGWPQAIGTPCVHVAAVANSFRNRQDELFRRFTDRGLLLNDLRLSLNIGSPHPIMVIDATDVIEDNLRKEVLQSGGRPGIVRGSRGAGGIRRVRSRGESIQVAVGTVTAPPQKKTRKQVCKKCGHAGHNARTCKNEVNES